MASWRRLANSDDDPQRERLYEAERQFTQRRPYLEGMTVELGRKLIRSVQRRYPTPKVKLSTVNYPTAWWGADSGICDGRAAIRFNVYRHKVNANGILHEMAHIITDHYYGEDLMSHCPEFVGVLRYLYHNYTVIPADAFALILARCGVRHRSMAESSPAALKALRKRRLRRAAKR